MDRCAGDPKAVFPKLLAAPNDDDWRAAQCGFRKLAKKHQKECLSTFRLAVRDADPAIRVRAAQTMPMIDKKDRTSQFFIIRALGDANILCHENPGSGTPSPRFDQSRSIT